jgi:HD-GYP domain-containing protein (c-di-GMP phosphodiesterase class II)
VATAATDPVWDQTLDPDADGLILESRARRQRRLVDRDRWASLAIGGGFAVAAIALAASLQTTRTPALWTYLFYAALYAAVSRVQFEIGTGAALPTQLVLVPMLFVLPLGYVPICVLFAFLLRDPRGYWRGGARVDRLLLMMVSAWHVVGPVLVLALALRPQDRSPAWSHWPVYLAALAAQFAFDLGASSLREWAGNGLPPRTTARFMAWVFLVDAALATVGLMVAFAASGHAALVLLVLPLVGLLRLFSRERVQRIDHALELGQAYRGTAFLLGDVVEADDAYTGEHSRDVVNLTLAVARRLGLSQREQRDAEFVALLHDVGKIRIPSEIINKAGPLDAEEREVIETHTLIGEEMLSRVGGLLGKIGRIVRSCHERWDGSGYPDGLAGERIPLIARIVCATDAYSAMTADRPYRQARSAEEAVAELRRCAGTHFDPRVVEALVECVASPIAA